MDARERRALQRSILEAARRGDAEQMRELMGRHAHRRELWTPRVTEAAFDGENWEVFGVLRNPRDPGERCPVSPELTHKLAAGLDPRSTSEARFRAMLTALRGGPVPCAWHPDVLVRIPDRFSLSRLSLMIEQGAPVPTHRTRLAMQVNNPDDVEGLIKWLTFGGAKLMCVNALVALVESRPAIRTRALRGLASASRERMGFDAVAAMQRSLASAAIECGDCDVLDELRDHVNGAVERGELSETECFWEDDAILRQCSVEQVWEELPWGARARDRAVRMARAIVHMRQLSSSPAVVEAGERFLREQERLLAEGAEGGGTGDCGEESEVDWIESGDSWWAVDGSCESDEKKEEGAELEAEEKEEEEGGGGEVEGREEEGEEEGEAEGREERREEGREVGEVEEKKEDDGAETREREEDEEWEEWEWEDAVQEEGLWGVGFSVSEREEPWVVAACETGVEWTEWVRTCCSEETRAALRGAMGRDGVEVWESVLWALSGPVRRLSRAHARAHVDWCVQALLRLAKGGFEGVQPEAVTGGAPPGFSVSARRAFASGAVALAALRNRGPVVRWALETLRECDARGAEEEAEQRGAPPSPSEPLEPWAPPKLCVARLARRARLMRCLGSLIAIFDGSAVSWDEFHASERAVVFRSAAPEAAAAVARAIELGRLGPRSRKSACAHIFRTNPSVATLLMLGRARHLNRILSAAAPAIPLAFARRLVASGGEPEQSRGEGGEEGARRGGEEGGGGGGTTGWAGEQATWRCVLASRQIDAADAFMRMPRAIEHLERVEDLSEFPDFQVRAVAALAHAGKLPLCALGFEHTSLRSPSQSAWNKVLSWWPFEEQPLSRVPDEQLSEAAAKMATWKEFDMLAIGARVSPAFGRAVSRLRDVGEDATPELSAIIRAAGRA